MSERIEIDKTVTIEIQIDYIKCKCGNELAFSIESDTHNDLQIEADPCSICIKEGQS